MEINLCKFTQFRRNAFQFNAMEYHVPVVWDIENIGLFTYCFVPAGEINVWRI